MTEWNDDRLDEFRERVDDLNHKVVEGFGMVRKELIRINHKIDTKFDAFYRVLIQAAVAMTVGILGLLGVVIGLYATQAS